MQIVEIQYCEGVMAKITVEVVDGTTTYWWVSAINTPTYDGYTVAEVEALTDVTVDFTELTIPSC